MAADSKLAVILHADIVGSTALVQKDERIAHERIRAAFSRLSDSVAHNAGETLELRGDALVAQFQRASDAIAAAIAFQEDNARRSDARREAIAIQVRIESESLWARSSLRIARSPAPGWWWLNGSSNWPMRAGSSSPAQFSKRPQRGCQ